MPCEMLSREFKNSEGEPKLFTTRQLPATKSLELHVELVNKLGSSCFPFIDGKYNYGDIITLMRANEHPVVSELIKRVVCSANFEGSEVKPHNFDLLFGNELMLICQVFAFVLEANFKSFFKQGLEMNEQSKLEEEARLAQAKQQSSCPKT